MRENRIYFRITEGEVDDVTTVTLKKWRVGIWTGLILLSIEICADFVKTVINKGVS